MKRLSRILSFVLFLSLIAGSAEACYTAREREAEQGLRIHSELMVISLTCNKVPGDEDLYHKYEHFTRKNEDLLSSYETTLLNYYDAEGVKSPEKKLHTLRTDMANNISDIAISMSTRTFCGRYASHLDQALDMNHERLRHWAQHVSPSQPMSERMCSRD
jgi:hypothetical protein